MGVTKRTRLAFILFWAGVLLGWFAEAQTTASWTAGIGITGSGIATLLLAWEGKGQKMIIALLLIAGVVASMGTLLTGDPNAMEAAGELLLNIVKATGELAVLIVMFLWGVAMWFGWYWPLLIVGAGAYIHLRLSRRQPKS